MVLVFDLLDKIEATTKRNEKIELLKSSEELGIDGILKELLNYAYNPYKKYNIVEFGEVEPLPHKEPTITSYTRFLEHLDLLEKRILTGGEALSTINTFFNKLNEREIKWYSRVLKKDLKAGITSTTINKVFPGLIPVFECMLAKSWDKVKRKPKEVMVDGKLDGYRALAFVDNGKVELFTRNGKEIIGFKDVEDELRELPSGMVYDGELIGKDEEFTDMQKLVFNKKVSEKAGTLVIFDLIPIEEFKKGKSEKTLRERKEDLKHLYETKNFQHIDFLCRTAIIDVENEWEEVERLYENYTEAGYEGIMIKDANSVYECKRSSAWTKWKPFDFIDLEVIGSVEGTGKFEGKLGALIVDFEGYEVEVGSGFTDSQREELWEKRNELVGKIIEIQYQDITSNDKGTKSLRFPTFKQFRPDKE